MVKKRGDFTFSIYILQESGVLVFHVDFTVFIFISYFNAKYKTYQTWCSPNAAEWRLVALPKSIDFTFLKVEVIAPFGYYPPEASYRSSRCIVVGLH